MSAGRKHYRCAECQTVTLYHWTAFERASRPRCTACGSIALDAVVVERPARAARKARVESDYGTCSCEDRPCCGCGL